MDSPIGEDGDTSLGDLIVDTCATPAEAAVQSGLRDAVKSVLVDLAPREASVLRMRFGIDMKTDFTLDEIGRKLNLTRERVRQIESAAMLKLKKGAASDVLRTFAAA
jgi:RNA polymerase primary sigma factor